MPAPSRSRVPKNPCYPRGAGGTNTPVDPPAEPLTFETSEPVPPGMRGTAAEAPSSLPAGRWGTWGTAGAPGAFGAFGAFGATAPSFKESASMSTEGGLKHIALSFHSPTFSK